MHHNEALFEKSCLRCHPTHSYHRMGSCHAMAECLLFEEGLFVLLVPDVLLHDILFYTLRLLGVFSPASRIEYIFGRKPKYSAIARPVHSSFNFPRTFLLAELYRGWSRGVVGCVIEGLVLGHVLLHILGSDLKEKAVSVRVEELAAFSVLRFELDVIEVVHQVLGEIQNAHAHIHRAIEYQVALVDLDSCQIIVEDIGPSKRWAGDKATEFVLLMRTHQLHINPLPQVFHGLPEVVHQLV